MKLRFQHLKRVTRYNIIDLKRDFNSELLFFLSNIYLFFLIKSDWDPRRFLQETNRREIAGSRVEIAKKLKKEDEERKEEGEKTKEEEEGRRKGRKMKKNYAIIRRGRKKGAISRQRAFAAAGPTLGFSRVNHGKKRTGGVERRRRRRRRRRREKERGRARGKRAAERRRKRRMRKKASSEQLGNRQESRVIVWR